MALYTPEYQPTGDESGRRHHVQGHHPRAARGQGRPPSTWATSSSWRAKGFYDNLKFHRYVPGFVIQGGCPNTRDLSPEDVAKAAGNPYAGLGTGGPGYSIKEEYTTNPHNQPRGRRARHGALPEPRLAQARSSTSAWAPSPCSTRATRCSARPSKAWTSIGQLRVRDVIESTSRSRTRRSSPAAAHSTQRIQMNNEL